ncbi:MAG: hypothetical protein ACR2M5_11510 [Nakamurella sp.]|jgi:hypothetical protein
MFGEMQYIVMMGQALVRKRVNDMRRNGERGAGGQSLEQLVLLAGGVVAGLALVAWLVVKITSKEGTVNP